MWGYGKPGRWSEVDLLLIEALRMHKDGLCPGCGHPLDHTSNIKNIRQWQLDDIQCHACEFLENDRKNAASGSGSGQSGVKRFIRRILGRA